MSFFFYTVNPDNIRCPKSYILRVFKDDGETKALHTINVTVKNPNNPSRQYKEADELGALLVGQLMAKELKKGGNA